MKKDLVLKRHGNNHNVVNHAVQNNDEKQQQHSQLPLPRCYNVNIRFDPIAPETGTTTEFILSIADQKLGDQIKEFELAHDKLMHVIIVGEDLSYFAHIHPTIRNGNGDDTKFSISHTFPESGKYKIWVDFKPKGGNQTLAAFKVTL